MDLCCREFAKSKRKNSLSARALSGGDVLHALAAIDTTKSQRKTNQSVCFFFILQISNNKKTKSIEGHRGRDAAAVYPNQVNR